MKGAGRMPNRILKESICRSEEIDSLSWFEEVLFYRLIVTCDDFGRYDGRSKVIKGACFPLKDITEKDIDKALSKLSAVGLVRVYEAQGRPYLQLVTWAEHQRIRNQKSKYPECDSNCIILLSNDSKCQQMMSDDNKCVRNPIQSKSESKTESNANICSELKQSEPPLIALELNTGEDYGITKTDIDEWSELYPAVDVMQCLRNMKGWLSANKAKRKTARGIKRFITTWLQKEQDRGGSPGYMRQVTASSLEQKMQMAKEWANE